MPQTVTILCYHRIDTPGRRDLSPALIDASPAAFAAQMRYVASHYNVVSTWDIVRAVRGEATLPARALAITFDDGYRCFATTALPILRTLGLPAALFVATERTSNPWGYFWWDALYAALANSPHSSIELPGEGTFSLAGPADRQTAYRRLVHLVETRKTNAAERLVELVVERCHAPVAPPVDAPLLGWDEVTGLAAEGIDIGPHTKTHPILSQTSPEQLRDEVQGAWDALRERVPNAVPLFCYPNGQTYAVNGRVVEAVRGAGFAAACTMVAGPNVLGRTNPYLLHRAGGVYGESLGRFKLKISPIGHIYRSLKAAIIRQPRSRFEV